MKRILAALAGLFLPLVASAAPFIACDLAVAATHSAIQFCTAINAGSCTTWGAWGADTSAVVVGANKECRHDVSASPVGASIVRVKAIAVDPAWGRQESAPSDPFAYSRPASPTSPAGTRLIP
jgi:hypothetical protein